MTVFVVSLFLPNTVNFKLPKTDTSERDADNDRRLANRINTSHSDPRDAHIISLFNAPRDITPPDTPVADVADHDEFFAQNNDLRIHFPKQEDPRSILAPSDPHSPAWGSGRLFTQPQSRASSPPPADILKHKKTAEKAVALGRAGVRQPQLTGRSDSHDRVFAVADWTVVPAEQGNGGLRNAVQAAQRNGLHEKTWVGTLGMPTDALEGTQKKLDIEDRLATEHDCLTVFCKDSDFDGHYTHYCKQILWPVFHYQIPDNPKSKAYEDHSWVYYVKVNQAFADKIVKNWRRGDVIWIHDYHLLLVPAMVRKKLPDAKIGFFLHVAFPSSEVFRCLAVRKELLEGLLGANLIGFQIHEYARHFLQTCSRILCVEATTDGVQLEDRFVDVFSSAIGIDPIALELNRMDREVAIWLKTMQDRYRGKKLIVARDKLDHVRGVRQKLLSYELFLNKYPEWRDRVVMIQVATSTTEQAELDATVSDIVTRVNSSWANLAYQPVVYLKQDISYPQYIALLTVADALMITSQREGMNLTSHEYLFCQDGKFEGHNKHGSLILSEFTGSASVFGGNELSVNPWDYKQCAEAIHTALTMDDDEKKRRFDNLHEAVMKHTANAWFNNFLTRLDKAHDEHHRRGSISVPRFNINKAGLDYQNSYRRLFILDYEGTLASWGAPNDIILTSPQRTLDVLNDLLAEKDNRNTVYVTSSRQPEELDRLFRVVPNLGLIAENGCFLKHPGSSKWIEMADPEEMQSWKDSIIPMLKYFHDRTPHSWIEHLHCSIIFHYKDCEDQEGAARMAGECANHINDTCEKQNVKAIVVPGAVIVESTKWSKGTAAQSIFETLKKEDFMKDKALNSTPDYPVEFLMVAGDGRDDEVIFQWANSLGQAKAVKHVVTVGLGSRNTEANCTITQGVTGVLTSLSRLSKLGTNLSADHST